MINLFIFILSTSGFAWGVTRSKLFKSIRETVSYKVNLLNIAVKSTQLKSFSNTVKYKFYWLLDSVLNCGGCFGFWAGIIIYQLMEYKVYVLVYAFIGAIVSLFIISFINFLDKK